MRRIMVTGAGGFVGQHAVSSLVRDLAPGDRVAGLYRGPMPDPALSIEAEQIDILDMSSLAGFVNAFKPTHVLHLAALSSVQQSNVSPRETWKVNLRGLMNLADALGRAAAGSTFYFVSSAEVYGSAFLSGHALVENVLPQPATAYARSKLAGELMLRDLLPAYRIKVVVLRPFNHVGAGQDERFVLASFAGQIARMEAGLTPAVLEVGDLSVRRDFLDVRDVVRAYLMLLARSDEVATGSVYNISSGRARSLSSILETLRSMAHVPFVLRVSHSRLRPSEIPQASGDSSAITSDFGWKPTIPWSETLECVLDDARRRVARNSN